MNLIRFRLSLSKFGSQELGRVVWRKKPRAIATLYGMRDDPAVALIYAVHGSLTI
jgi:hypothetical protein